MTLKLTLKPGESVYIGKTRLTVEAQATCTVYVNGSAPIMRANEMIEPGAANESVSRYRYVLQEMYLSDDFQTMIADYVEAVAKLLAERPDLSENVQEANQMVRLGKLYDAVKIGRRMAARHGKTG